MHFQGLLCTKKREAKQMPKVSTKNQLIYFKYYKNSNESCTFLFFLADLAVRAVLNISAVLLNFWWCFFIFLLAKQIQNLSFCTLLLHISCQTIVAVALAMIKTGHLCNSSGHARWPNKDTGAVVAFPYTDWLLAAAAMARRRRWGSAQACMG